MYNHSKNFLFVFPFFLTLFGCLFFSFGLPSFAAGPGENCTITATGPSSETKMTGICREAAHEPPCTPGETAYGIADCAVTNGKAYTCCYVPVPSTSCTALGGHCTQNSSCRSEKVITNATSGCFFGNDYVCCGETVSYTSPNAKYGNDPSLNSKSDFDYTLLEKIPGQSSTQSDLPSYIKAILNSALILIVLAAVFMVSVGGFLYLTSAGNTSKANDAKNIIFDSLIGLGLAMLAYLILFVINPDLVNLRLSQMATTTPTSTPTPPTASSGDTYTHDEAVAALSAKGIIVTSSGNCSDPRNIKCTSLEGIPKTTIDNVIALKDKTGCSFRITGGTEDGHKSHGAGQPIVDLSEEPCLENTLKNKSSLSSYNISKICADQNSQIVAYNCSHIEPKPHFHIQFSN